MPLRDKLRKKLVDPLANRIRDRLPSDVRDLIDSATGKRSPHESGDYLPPEIRDRVDSKSPAHEFNNFASIVGDVIGPSGEQGALAVANGKSGDASKFPLPQDPAHPKAVFFENGMSGIVRSIGQDTVILEIPDRGLFHFKRENVHQMKQPKERVNPMKREYSLKGRVRLAPTYGSSLRNRVRIGSMRIVGGKKTLDRLVSKDPTNDEAIRALGKEDPSPNHDWLEQMYKWFLQQQKVGIPDEGNIKIISDLAHDIDRYSQALKDEEKPINPFGYKTLREASDAVASLKAKKVRPKLRKRDAKYETVYDKDGLKIYKPENKEASCTLGSDSDWCASKWNADWYERRLEEIGQPYIARFDDGPAYMIRVDDNGTIVTAFNKKDDDVLESRDEHVGKVFNILMKLGIANGVNEEDDEPEEGMMEVYFILDKEENIIASGYSSTEAIRKLERNNSLEALQVRGEGYTVYEMQVPEGSSAYDWDVANGREYDTVDPEMETMYVVAQPPQGEEISVLFSSESIDGIHDFLKDPKNRTTLLERGFKVYKSEIPVHLVDDPDQWELDDNDIIDEQEAGEEADAAATGLVDVYFGVPKRDTNSPVVITSFARHPGNVVQNRDGYAERIFKTQVPQRDLNRLMQFFNNPSRLSAYFEPKMQGAKVVENRPERLEERWYILVNGRPTLRHGYDDEEVAREAYKAQIDDEGLKKVELVEETAPTYNRSDVRSKKVIETREPDLTGQKDGVTVSETILNGFPIGTIVWLLGGADQQPTGRALTKINDEMWRSSGSGWGPNGQGDRATSRIFPFAGAPMRANVRFPTDAIKAEETSEASETPDFLAQNGGYELSAQQATKLPIGTVMTVSGRGATEEARFDERRRYTRLPPEKAFNTSKIWTSRGEVFSSAEIFGSAGEKRYAYVVLPSYETEEAITRNAPTEPSAEPQVSEPVESTKPRLETVPGGTRIRMNTGRVWTKDPQKTDYSGDEIQMWTDMGGRQVEQDVLQYDEENWELVGENDANPNQTRFQFASRVRIGSMRISRNN